MTKQKTFLTDFKKKEVSKVHRVYVLFFIYFFNCDTMTISLKNGFILFAFLFLYQRLSIATSLEENDVTLIDGVDVFSLRTYC